MKERMSRTFAWTEDAANRASNKGTQPHSEVTKSFIIKPLQPQRVKAKDVDGFAWRNCLEPSRPYGADSQVEGG